MTTWVAEDDEFINAMRKISWVAVESQGGFSDLGKAHFKLEDFVAFNIK